MAWMAQAKTAALLALLTGILLAIGYGFGGSAGLFIGFVFALFMNAGAYWFSDRIVLAMHRARPLSREEAPRLHAAVEKLAQRAGIPTPRLYLVDEASPNAFATGRSPSHAAVAVTAGITRLLNEQELEGVLAHEIAHIKNYDTLVSTAAAVIAGTIAYIATMAQWAALFGWSGRGRGASLIELLALIILAPLIATLVRLAVSRTREFLADETGARLQGTGQYLASALLKLEHGARQAPMHANAGTAHLFIVNPLSGEALAGLFSTHPPTRERVRRLRNL